MMTYPVPAASNDPANSIARPDTSMIDQDSETINVAVVSDRDPTTISTLD